MANADAVTLCRLDLHLTATQGSQRVVITPENPIKSGLKSRLKTDRGIDWAVAVNRARIPPRHVLDAVFGTIGGHLTLVCRGQ